jgi:AcrR family transcriptional regulator
MSHRAGLDRKAVVLAAAELADKEGIEQLTLAQLAAHLGVRTPSLYNHVGGLADLRRELTLLCARDLTSRFTRAAIGKSGEEAIVAIANAYRAYAREHPGLYALIEHAPDPEVPELQAAAQELVEVFLAVLAAYKLQKDDALHAVRGLRSTIHGFVSLEVTGGFGLPLDLDETFRRLIKMFIVSLTEQVWRADSD